MPNCIHYVAYFIFLFMIKEFYVEGVKMEEAIVLFLTSVSPAPSGLDCGYYH